MFEAPRQSRSALLASTELAAAPPAPIDFIKIGHELWRGRTTILLTTVVALAFAVLIVLIAPHKYTAVTEILIDPTDLRAVANEPTPSGPLGETALIQVQSQVRVLTSDDVLGRVVAAQGLAHDPEFVGGGSPLHSLVAWLSGALGRGRTAAAANPSLSALNELRRHVAVTRAERTYVVDVSVTSRDPAKAARLANAVAQAYLNEQTQVRSDAARQVSQSLGARLNDLKERVHAAEERVQDFKVEHNIVDANGQSVSEQQLSDLNNQLAAARARMTAAKAQLDQIESVQRTRMDVGAFPEAVQSPTITALRTQYAEVMRLEAQQMTNLGARHPAVIEIQAQAERLRRMIADEVNRIALAARAYYGSAKANEELLSRNVDALEQKTLTTDAAMVSLRELQREVQASRAIYEAFLVRAHQTAEEERVDTKNIQVISRADLPMSRSFPPSISVLALAAIVLGIGAGSGLVMFRGMFPGEQPPLPRAAPPMPGGARQPVRPQPPDAAAVDIPVLAVVPPADYEPDGSADGANSRFAEGIRHVYETVQQCHDNSGNPSLLVVAATDGNDVAAVALTLAALAATSERVLLIDADLERRTLDALDAGQSEAGLVDVALGRCALSDVAVRDGKTKINLLPFVAPNSRRDRAISDDDIRTAFAQTRHFDMVIVAGADIDSDPSARFFAGLVDHIVLVVRADEPDPDSVDASVSRLGVDARKIRGAVLTGAEAA
jgi:polysaccharide biosynthesis transport protein